MLDDHNNPFERIKISELADHEFREMVNELTNVARLFANTQQLRERVSGLMIKHLRPLKDTTIRSTDIEATAEITANFLVENDPIIEAVHMERRTTRLSEEEIDHISYSMNNDNTQRMLLFMEQYSKAQHSSELQILLSRYRKEERREAISQALALLRR